MAMKRYVVVGGVAGGMSAAARLRRLDPGAEITVLEKGADVSWANCGLPYHVSGEIAERGALLLHTPESLGRTLRIDVFTRTEAVDIDVVGKVVVARGADGGALRFGYDALVLSPGSRAVRPPIAGLDDGRVHTLRTIPDADAIREMLADGAKRAVVIGAGFIGLEAVEALRHAGLEVAVVEAAAHVLPAVDPEIADHIREALVENGVGVFEGVFVRTIENVGAHVVVHLSDGQALDADLVILSAGVKPRLELAHAAGLQITESGAIWVDEFQKTSDPFIWAVGDACAAYHAVTGEHAPIPLAAPANRGGRVAADSIMGRERSAPKLLGTAIVRVFDLSIAVTGASRRALGAKKFHTVRTHSGHHAGYYPGAETMHLLMHFDDEGNILGAQGVGRAGIDKRIDVLATAIRGGLKTDDLIDLDLTYAPPFGSAKDPVMMLGMIAENVRSGLVVQCDVERLEDRARLEGALVIDVRGEKEFAEGRLPGAVRIAQCEIHGRLEEIRQRAEGREVVVYCKSGFRSYLAHRELCEAGIESSTVSGGYLTAVRFSFLGAGAPLGVGECG